MIFDKKYQDNAKKEKKKLEGKGNKAPRIRRLLMIFSVSTRCYSCPFVTHALVKKKKGQAF